MDDGVHARARGTPGLRVCAARARPGGISEIRIVNRARAEDPTIMHAC